MSGVLKLASQSGTLVDQAATQQKRQNCDTRVKFGAVRLGSIILAVTPKFGRYPPGYLAEMNTETGIQSKGVSGRLSGAAFGDIFNFGVERSGCTGKKHN
jgi:hypothetical protein